MILGGGPRAFGALAASYVEHLQGVPAFVVSEDPQGAWDEMLAARRTGADFAVMIVLQDRRAVLALQAANDVLCQIGGYDERRPYFDAIERGDLDLGGRTILQHSAWDPDFVARARQLQRLGTVLIVRSFAELRRLRDAFGPIRCNVARWFPARSVRVSPAPHAAAAVLWAPQASGDAAAVGAFALSQSHREVLVVSKDPPKFSGRFRHMEPGDDALPAALQAAGCIVDLNLGDPGWAYAFAQRGFAVAAASTSGADEMLDGVALYDPWSFQSLARAVAEAFGRGPARPRANAPELGDVTRSLEAAQVERPPREPLVTVIVPTYNRRAYLERTLRELVRQHYANIEVLVVNDGGEPVGHVAEFDPRIRVVEREVNAGAIRAINFGLTLARGEYVEILPDDDRLYPDHILRLVAALERTGASVAHSNTLLCIDTVGKDGVPTTIYNTERFNDTVDLCEAYAYHRVARFLARRRVLEELGGFAEDLFVSDLEMLLRVAERYDFVHVPAITAEVSLHGSDQMSMRPGLDHAEAMRALFARHPAAGRPYVAALRKAVLAALQGPASTPGADS